MPKFKSITCDCTYESETDKTYGEYERPYYIKVKGCKDHPDIGPSEGLELQAGTTIEEYGFEKV